MIVTPKDAAQAEILSRAQRAASAALLVVDAARAGSEEAKALCEEVAKAAAKAKVDPKTYDQLLHRQAVAALFALGALKFERT